MPVKDQTAKHDDQATRQVNTLAPVQAGPVVQAMYAGRAGLQRAILNPGRAQAADILALQRAAGNSAVSRLIQTKLSVGPAGDGYEQEADRVAEQVLSSQPEVASPSRPRVQRDAQKREEEGAVQASPLSASITPLVQRQDKEEEEEQVQAKFLVQRQDKEEEEQVQAKSLVQRQDKEEEEQIQAKFLVQRQDKEEEEQVQAKLLVQPLAPDLQGGFEAAPKLENRLSALKGGGSPLPGQVRAYMEPRFGADFSGVRVHTGGEAVQMNREIQAKAFTHGQDIYLGASSYAPDTDAGKRLVAHELTHVVQQTGAGVQRSVRWARGSAGLPPVEVSRAPSGLRRDVIQRDIQSYAVWKATSALDWKMRSGELTKIDSALAEWDLKRHHTDKTVKIAALTKLASAIDRWLGSKKQEKKAAKRNVAVRGLQAQVYQTMDELRPQGENATLTLNVDVESANSWNRTIYETAHSAVGHAWLSLKYDTPDAGRLGGAAGFNEYNLKELRAGPTGKASFGFYPYWFTPDEDYRRLYYDRGGETNPAPSTLAQPDKLHMPKAEKTYRVDDTKVQAVGQVIQEFQGRAYNMVTGPNCVTFAARAIEAAGFQPPQFKLHALDQVNKMYRSVIRLGKGGDTAVTSQLEMAKQVARDGTKNFDNLTPTDARALNQLGVRHVSEARAEGLHDVRREIIPALVQIFNDAPAAAKQAMLQQNPATRWPDWRMDIQVAAGDNGRLFGMQMAAAVIDQQEFEMWMPKYSAGFEMESASTFVRDATKTYNDVTADNAPALVRATVEGQAESLRALNMLKKSDVFNDLYRLYHARSNADRAQIETSPTRQATMADWIQNDDERPDWSNDLARAEHIQFMAVALNSEAWDAFSRFARQNLRDNVAPKPRAG